MTTYVPCNPSSTTIPFLGCCKTPLIAETKGVSVIGDLYGFKEYNNSANTVVRNELNRYRVAQEEVTLPLGSMIRTWTMDDDGRIDLITEEQGEIQKELDKIGRSGGYYNDYSSTILEATFFQQRFVDAGGNPKGSARCILSVPKSLIEARNKIQSALLSFDGYDVPGNIHSWIYFFEAGNLYLPTTISYLTSSGSFYSIGSANNTYYLGSGPDIQELPRPNNYNYSTGTYTYVGGFSGLGASPVRFHVGKAKKKYPVGIGCKAYYTSFGHTDQSKRYRCEATGKLSNWQEVLPDIIDLTTDTHGYIWHQDETGNPNCCV